jgi:hypothetical protein
MAADPQAPPAAGAGAGRGPVQLPEAETTRLKIEDASGASLAGAGFRPSRPSVFGSAYLHDNESSYSEHSHGRFIQVVASWRAKFDHFVADTKARLRKPVDSSNKLLQNWNHYGEGLLFLWFWIVIPLNFAWPEEFMLSAALVPLYLFDALLLAHVLIPLFGQYEAVQLHIIPILAMPKPARI